MNKNAIKKFATEARCYLTSKTRIFDTQNTKSE